eukprot:3191028-Rhodomonas_salina.1
MIVVTRVVTRVVAREVTRVVTSVVRSTESSEAGTARARASASLSLAVRSSATVTQAATGCVGARLSSDSSSQPGGCRLGVMPKTPVRRLQCSALRVLRV